MPRASATAPARVALVLGTSTSSIGATEDAYRAARRRRPLSAETSADPLVHTPHSLGDVRAARRSASKGRRHGLHRLLVERQGVRAGRAADPRSAWSTPRSSAASTRCAAACCSASTRWSWCRPQPCRPFDAARDGISLGEAAGFALLERVGDAAGTALAPARLRRSQRRAPHVDAASRRPGRRARARRCAGARRRVDATRSTTSTCTAPPARKNDEVEAALVARRFPARTHASSTKGFTGHTLGAAGIVEAVDQPAGDRDTACCPARSTRAALDPALRAADPAATPARGEVRIALSNSFGFGGNNCVAGVRPARARVNA